MAIEAWDGGVTVTGDDIGLVRLMTLRRGLALEIKTGLTLSRGRSCYKIIKAEFGLEGSKAKVLAAFNDYVDTTLATSRGMTLPEWRRAMSKEPNA